jgi:hypothetical protein
MITAQLLILRSLFLSKIADYFRLSEERDEFISHALSKSKQLIA